MSATNAKPAGVVRKPYDQLIMTAKDLLNKVLDYNHQWSSSNRKYSKPATVRLSQIEALQEAFGLTKRYVNPFVQVKYLVTGKSGELDRAKHLNKLTNLEYLLQGEFLKDRDVEANKGISERIISKVTSLYPDMTDYIHQKPLHVNWLFNNLLNFRQEIYKITDPWGGMLEGFSAALHYSYYLQGKLQEIIKNNLSEIDETLWLILDPTKKEVSKEEINYPDADLEDIDQKWRMDNLDNY